MNYLQYGMNMTNKVSAFICINQSFLTVFTYCLPLVEVHFKLYAFNFWYFIMNPTRFSAKSVPINTGDENDDSLVFISEAVPTCTQRTRAVNLGLPPTFFLYEKHARERVQDTGGKGWLVHTTNKFSILLSTNDGTIKTFLRIAITIIVLLL